MYAAPTFGGTVITARRAGVAAKPPGGDESPPYGVTQIFRDPQGLLSQPGTPTRKTPAFPPFLEPRPGAAIHHIYYLLFILYSLPGKDPCHG